MARDLRPRKKAPDAQSGPEAAAVTEKNLPKSKRKAVEDNSPISRKISKSTKSIDSNGKKSSAKSAKKSEPVAEELEISSGSDSEEEQGEQGVLALAKNLDPEDEGAVDETAVFKPGQDVGKIPEVAKPTKSAKGSNEEPGVIYIGRIPHGFYEHEMKQYLSQFGPINKLRLSRNKKTGASKHFAFVEFAEASTAEIVAKTMNNYLLFGHILKCTTVHKEQVHEDLFKGANQRFKKVPWNKMAGKRLEKGRTQADWSKRAALEQKKRGKAAAKLKAIGYDFNAPDLKDVPPPPVAEITEGEVQAVEAPKVAEEAVAVEENTSVQSPVGEPEEEAVPAPKKAGKAGKAGKTKRTKT